MDAAREAGERSVKPKSESDFQFQVLGNQEKASFALTVIYSLARNQISCARHETL